MATYFLELPCTKEAESLLADNRETNAAEREQLDFHIKYRLHESGEYAEYCGIYYEDEKENEEDDYIVVPFTSTLKEMKEYAKDTTFVNVIGSSHDRPVVPWTTRNMSWVECYDVCIGTFIAKRPYRSQHCFTDHRFYYTNGTYEDQFCNNGYCPYCNTRKNLVGGHIVIGTDDRSAVRPKGIDIGIVPICNRHNMNNNGFMKLAASTWVLMIIYTLPIDVYQTHLKKAREKR